jgi:hypothetical protein
MSKKPNVIVVNGYPRSGKDTFCGFADKSYDCIHYSTVDTVKSIAMMMGWDGVKTDENRAMLSALKDFTTKWFDMTFKEMTELIQYEIEYDEIGDGETDFIFLHIREPKEIKRIMDWCTENDINCYSVCITRSAVDGVEFSNHADKEINEMIYDVYLKNNGSLERFRFISERFFGSVISGELRE